MRSSVRYGWLVLVVLLVSQVTSVAAQPGVDLPAAVQSAGSDAAPAKSVTAATPVRIGDKLVDQPEVTETSKLVVEFAAKPDLAGPSQIEDFAGRGEAVVAELQTTATNSQRAAIQLLRERGVAFEAYWFRNVIVVDGNGDIAAELAALPGVADVRPERIYPLIRPVERGEAIAVDPGDPEWGVAQIGAPQVWAEGILGSGIVVANIDSGVDYTHPALVSQYRGNLGDGAFEHDYNWWDPTGVCGDSPCDNAEHGTHVMGTIVGGDGPGPFVPDIGVAPGARWIAAKGCEDFGCSESALLSSGQWILAPTDTNGENPDPARRPDIVNNSWGGGPGDPFYLDVVQAWRAAGIIPVFSSGNPGPFCGEGGSPGDFVESFSVGATDIDDLIAEFSGRGPSVFGKINPDVSAPGVDVTSSVPGDGYASFSGTSMAAPHVSGALALMLSASPGLIGDIDGATGGLAATAIDIIDLSCGGDEDGDPNNVYGDGRIDAQAAVNLVATGGTLAGAVTDAATGDPLAGASVIAQNAERQFRTTTDDTGAFSLFLAADTYLVTASAFAYETAAVSGVVIETDQTTEIALELEKLPTFVLSGSVRRAENRAQPVEGAIVDVVGVPLDPITTGANGRFSFELPQGTYTVTASQGGCMTRDERTVNLIRNRRATLWLMQNIDEFGHGCEPIPFEWVDATSPTTVYGDDQTGRLPMPFGFPFYGENYNELFIASNGYMTFVDEFFGFSEYFNSPLPSGFPPNAGVYALWQDLWVVGDSIIEYDLIDGPSGQTFVVEYSNVPPLGAEDGADFEVKLHEDGTIDLLYGSGMQNVAFGSNATVGIENADGSDALQVAFQDGFLTENSAWRISEVPTGFVAGVVTSANDGLPIAGATITASPGGRSATTASDGSYSLRLLPGRYAVTATAPGYNPPVSRLVTLRADQTFEFNPSLRAPRAEVTPTAIDAATDLGEAVTETVTITNTGSGPLRWEARERDSGGTPPVLPAEPSATIVRPIEWAAVSVPADFSPSLAISPNVNDDLEVIIDDPIGDALGPVDITAVRAQADAVDVMMQLDFVPGTPVNQSVGVVFLDTDQDPATGLPAEAFFGLPTQDVGMEYFVDLFGAPEGVGFIIDANTFEFIAEIEVELTETAMRFSFPLELIGGDDGFINVDTVMGDFNQPTDWAADVGHGTIQPFTDAPWMSASPESGRLQPGQSTDVEVTLGGPGIDPGDYSGELTFVTNDPRTPNHTVDVTLSVALPANYGAVSGLVFNTRSGDPVPAELTLEAEDDGQPVVVTTVADDSGEFSMFAPEGTWPLSAVAEGYLDFTGEVTVTAGGTTNLEVGMDPLWPNAALSGGPLVFELGPDQSAEEVLTLSNAGGLADLEFVVNESDVGAPLAIPGATTRREIAAEVTSVDRRVGPGLSRAATNNNGATALVFLDLLPWDSEALLAVLDGNGVIFDIAGSGDMATANLAEYEAVFISNDQPQEFYDAYRDNADRFADYAAGGGFLWFGVAAWGFNGGDATGLPLPGGVTVADLIIESENIVVRPDHPVMTGVPEVFFGTEASHTLLEGVPADATLAIGAGSEEPTLVEYPFGAGMVMAFAQPLEYAWLVGQDAAIILENSVPYAIAFEPFVDIPWLSVSPAEGVVATDGEEELTVSVDTTGLEPGAYVATLVILTNDPQTPRLETTVTLIVS